MTRIIFKRIFDFLTGIIVGVAVSYYGDYIYLKMREEGLTPKLPFMATDKSGIPKNINVYLVPFEGFEESSANLLAKALSNDTGLNVSTTGSIYLPRDSFNQERNQYDLDQLNHVVESSINTIKTNDKQLFIAILKQDMYSSSNSWNFTLTGNFGNRISIVATERLIPFETKNYQKAEEIYGSRVYKLLKRTIGFQYFGYSRSDKPESVLYSPIMSIETIDHMSMTF